MAKKITILGSGDVGAMAGMLCAQEGLGDVVLVDIVEGLPQGRALDISQSLGLTGSSSKVSGSNNYEDTKGSDVVVITAGFPRKPGMSRDDLLAKNLPIVTTVAKEAYKHNPDAVFIVVTNPVDVMTHAVYKALGLPRERVMGMAGVLDSFRMQSFIAEEAGCKLNSVECMALGSHGDLMVPIFSHAKADGKPVCEVLSDEQIAAIDKRTVNGGGEIVGLLKTRSTMFAPAAAITRMVRAILKDEHVVLPVSALLDGEYGHDGVFVGVPALLSSKGIVALEEIGMDESEKERFESAVNHISEMTKKAGL